MKSFRYLIILAISIQFFCTPSKKSTRTLKRTDAFLYEILNQSKYFSNILKKADSLRVQIIYTQIDRGEKNEPIFKSYYFNVDPQLYFYPASTVKLPVALLSLQRVKELKKYGVDRSTTMITESAYSGQTPVYNDPTIRGGKPSIAHYIKKIFLVSDNDAFNRLYEFLGQEYINKELRQKGYGDVEIVHRLSIPLTEDENRHTNPVSFYDNAGKILYKQPMQVSSLTSFARHDLLGKGYYGNGELIKSPFNFSGKNRITLTDLQGILQSILFPFSVAAEKRFDIEPEDYPFVWKYMSQYPAETTFPEYDSSNYWDAYCKFLFWGSAKAKLPKNFRLFNKVGDAYGFLIDAAYIVDFDKKIEFMLAATILCNRDGIFNDDKYDYDSVGYPFMKQLGRLIYEFELKRSRPRAPDLTVFKLVYDK